MSDKDLGFWDKMLRRGAISRKQHAVMAEVEAFGSLLTRRGEVGLTGQTRALSLHTDALRLQMALDRSSFGTVLYAVASLVFLQFVREIGGSLDTIAVVISIFGAFLMFLGLGMRFSGRRKELSIRHELRTELNDLSNTDPAADLDGDIVATANAIRRQFEHIIHVSRRGTRLYVILIGVFMGMLAALYTQFVDFLGDPIDALVHFGVPAVTCLACLALTIFSFWRVEL